jgi:hypothetical protein
MRITNLPPSTQVSTPASTGSSQPVRSSFSTRLDGMGGMAPGAQAPSAVSGSNVLAAAMASQQASPNGALADAYGLAQQGKGTAIENVAAKIAKTPEQFAAIKEVVMQSMASTANSIFSMGSNSKIALDKD